VLQLDFEEGQTYNIPLNSKDLRGVLMPAKFLVEVVCGCKDSDQCDDLGNPNAMCFGESE